MTVDSFLQMFFAHGAYNVIKFFKEMTCFMPRGRKPGSQNISYDQKIADIDEKIKSCSEAVSDYKKKISELKKQRAALVTDKDGQDLKALLNAVKTSGKSIDEVITTIRAQ